MVVKAIQTFVLVAMGTDDIENIKFYYQSNRFLMAYTYLTKVCIIHYIAKVKGGSTLTSLAF